MFALLKRYKKNSVGATAIEYGLIAALIGTAIIGAVTTIGGNLSTTFGDIGNAVVTKKAATPAAGGS